jgi:hypothetical protein
MSIEIDALHKGLVGDFVPFILGSKGATHFVTPKFNRTGMGDYEALWNAAALGSLSRRRSRTLSRCRTSAVARLTPPDPARAVERGRLRKMLA